MANYFRLPILSEKQFQSVIAALLLAKALDQRDTERFLNYIKLFSGSQWKNPTQEDFIKTYKEILSGAVKMSRVSTRSKTYDKIVKKIERELFNKHDN